MRRRRSVPATDVEVIAYTAGRRAAAAGDEVSFHVAAQGRTPTGAFTVEERSRLIAAPTETVALWFRRGWSAEVARQMEAE